MCLLHTTMWRMLKRDKRFYGTGELMQKSVFLLRLVCVKRQKHGRICLVMVTDLLIVCKCINRKQAECAKTARIQRSLATSKSAAAPVPVSAPASAPSNLYEELGDGKM